MSQPERQSSASPTQLATFLLAIVALYFLASMVGRAINIVEIMRQQATLQARNEELSRDIAKLRDDVEYMQSDSYVEQAARSVLLWGRPGEKLIISRDGPLPAASTPTPPRRP